MFRRRSPIVERLIGAIYGFVFVWALLIVLALIGGCANGVQMDEAETKACLTEGCTVWTEDELRLLIKRSAMQGYYQGLARCHEAGRPGDVT